MTPTDIAGDAFFHAELRVCGVDGPKRCASVTAEAARYDLT
jgi:hypothetical protein